MLIIIGVVLFFYPGKLNPFWSLLSKNLIFGSLHMSSWFIGLFVLPLTYFSTLGLYSVKNIFKKKINIILICICIFVFWDYYRVNKPNLDYVNTIFTLNNEAYFNKNYYFEHCKGPDWNAFTYIDKTCFESDMMSTYLKNNRSVLQFYDSILGYDEFGFLRHSSVKVGWLDIFNKNPNIKIQWISPSKISLEILKTKKGRSEIPININYFPGWKIAEKIPGITLNKEWATDKWGLLTVYLDDTFPMEIKQKILIKYSPNLRIKYDNKIEIENEPTPITAEGWYMKGEELYESYDFENALNAFDNAIKLNPNYIPAWEEKGWLWAKLKKSKEAITCFDKVAVLKKKYNRFRNETTKIRDAEDYFINASSFLKENRFNEAILDFDNAIKLDNNYIKAYYYRGITYQLLQSFNKAIIDFNEVIKLNPEDAGVYLKRGNVYFQIKNYQNAILDFSKCIQINPKFVEAHNFLGKAYFHQKKYDQAMREYKTAIKLKPNYAVSHNDLGVLLNDLGNFREAEREYRKAIEIDPNNTVARNNLRLLLYNLKRDNEVEKELKEEININSNDIVAHYNLGILLYKTNRFAEAEKEFRTVIKINPEHAEAHYNLGILLDNSKRLNEAEKEYREVIKINPKHTEAHYYLGFLLDNSKRINEAEKEYKIAIEINPNFLEAHTNLGVLFFNSSRIRKAEKEFKDAININPRYEYAHYNLGCLYLVLKENSKALQEFEIALRLSPNDQDIKGKIRFLQQLLNIENK